MSEVLIKKLEALVTKMTKNIQNKELIPELQQEFDELVEYINNDIEIFTNEEYEKLDNAMNKSTDTLKNYENKIESLNNIILKNEETIKALKDQLSSNSKLSDQYKLLNDSYNQLNQQVKLSNDENSILQNNIKNF